MYFITGERFKDLREMVGLLMFGERYIYHYRCLSWKICRKMVNRAHGGAMCGKKRETERELVLILKYCLWHQALAKHAGLCTTPLRKHIFFPKGAIFSMCKDNQSPGSRLSRRP